MNLALFDLDHTLLPLDSDYEWGKFLASIKAIDPIAFYKANNTWYTHYENGTLDPIKYLEFTFSTLIPFSRKQLDNWRIQFIEEIIKPVILPIAVAVVKKHLDAGDLVAIVTATNSFITTPIAQLFNIEHLIAAQPELDNSGRFTGRLLGTPTYGYGKVIHTCNWLQAFGKTLKNFEKSHFYSDSQNDIPLLSCVTHPIATNPNDKLKTYAIAQGWSILDLFKI